VNRRWLFWSLAGALLVAFLVRRQLPDNKLHLYFHSDPLGGSVLVRTPAGRYFLLTDARSGTLLLNQVGADLPFWRRRLAAIVIIGRRDEVKGSVAALIARYRVGTIVLPDGGWRGPGSEALQMIAEQRHLALITDHARLQSGAFSLAKTENGWRLRFMESSFLLFCHHVSAEAPFCHLNRALKTGERPAGVLILPELPPGAENGCSHLPCYLLDRPDRLELIGDGAGWKVVR